MDPVHGPLLAVTLLPDPLRPPGEPIAAWALLDTGAKHSGVHAAAAKHLLGWPVVGAVELYTPGSTSEAVALYAGKLSIARDGAPIAMELLGLSLGYRAAGREVLVLLGRDFLNGKVFDYDGRKGEFSLHW